MVEKQDDNKEFREAEEKFDRLFDAAAGVQMSATPGFKERVLKNWDQKRAKPKASKFRALSWKPLAAAGLTLAVAALVFTQSSSQPSFEAGVLQQVAIRLDIKSHAKEKSCNVQIQLPEGVRFASAANPEIAENPSLELPCDAGAASGTLPIVLLSTEEGMKEVSVKFVDSDQKEISRANFKIRFKKNGEQA